MGYRGGERETANERRKTTSAIGGGKQGRRDKRRQAEAGSAEVEAKRFIAVTTAHYSKPFINVTFGFFVLEEATSLRALNFVSK